MKKSLLCLSLLGATLFNAQVETKSSDLKSEDYKCRENHVKFGITSLAFKNLQFSYERVLSKEFSINATLGIMPKGSIPFKSAITSEDVDLDAFKLGGTSFMLEPRYYVSKRGYGHGFYLAPYYRYSSYTIEGFSTNEELNNGKNVKVNLSGDVSAHSAGLAIGAQWFLGKKDNFVLDVWFIGGHYGASSGELKGKTNQTLTAAEQADLQNELNNIDGLPDVIKYETKVDSNSATMSFDGPWAGLRSGISLGYRF